MLQEALPELLTNYRQYAMRACVKGILRWGEVNPTPEDWSNSLPLSMMRLTLVGDDYDRYGATVMCNTRRKSLPCRRMFTTLASS